MIIINFWRKKNIDNRRSRLFQQKKNCCQCQKKRERVEGNDKIHNFFQTHQILSLSLTLSFIQSIKLINQIHGSIDVLDNQQQCHWIVVLWWSNKSNKEKKRMFVYCSIFFIGHYFNRFDSYVTLANDDIRSNFIRRFVRYG